MARESEGERQEGSRNMLLGILRMRQAQREVLASDFSPCCLCKSLYLHFPWPQPPHQKKSLTHPATIISTRTCILHREGQLLVRDECR